MQSEKHFLTFGYSVTNVVVQWFFLLGFLQVVVLYWTALCFRVFLIFFEIEELQSSKIAQVCKKVKAVTRWMSANSQS